MYLLIYLVFRDFVTLQREVFYKKVPQAKFLQFHTGAQVFLPYKMTAAGEILWHHAVVKDILPYRISAAGEHFWKLHLEIRFSLLKTSFQKSVSNKKHVTNCNKKIPAFGRLYKKAPYLQIRDIIGGLS